MPAAWLPGAFAQAGYRLPGAEAALPAFLPAEVMVAARADGFPLPAVAGGFLLPAVSGDLHREGGDFLSAAELVYCRPARAGARRAGAVCHCPKVFSVAEAADPLEVVASPPVVCHLPVDVGAVTGALGGEAEVMAVVRDPSLWNNNKIHQRANNCNNYRDNRDNSTVRNLDK